VRAVARLRALCQPFTRRCDSAPHAANDRRPLRPSSIARAPEPMRGPRCGPHGDGDTRALALGRRRRPTGSRGRCLGRSRSRPPAAVCRTRDGSSRCGACLRRGSTAQPQRPLRARTRPGNGSDSRRPRRATTPPGSPRPSAGNGRSPRQGAARAPRRSVGRAPRSAPGPHERPDQLDRDDRVPTARLAPKTDRRLAQVRDELGRALPAGVADAAEPRLEATLRKPRGLVSGWEALQEREGDRAVELGETPTAPGKACCRFASSWFDSAIRCSIRSLRARTSARSTLVSSRSDLSGPIRCPSVRRASAST